MGIFDLNFNPFKSTDGGNDFFSGLWTSRSEDAYKDFFSGGWKEPKNWLNPGGVMANPAQQLADPGNFFTSEEHENWLDGKVSDRTSMSALIAGMAYGGGALASGMGGGEGVAGTGLESLAGGSSTYTGGFADSLQGLGGGSSPISDGGGGGMFDFLSSENGMDYLDLMSNLFGNQSQQEPQTNNSFPSYNSNYLNQERERMELERKYMEEVERKRLEEFEQNLYDIFDL